MQSTVSARWARPDDRRIGVLLPAAMIAESPARARCGDVGVDHLIGGLMPSIHIMVVVVSPTTLPEPPAFEAATMAAR
jgi:hypothetical protein